jgi:signal transduction histidine kinase
MSQSPSPLVSLRTVLAALPLVVVLPMVLFSLFLLYRLWTESLINGEKDLNQLLQSQTLALEREVAGLQRELLRTGGVLMRHGLHSEEFRAYAGSVTDFNRGWNSISLIDAQGRRVIQTAQNGAVVGEASPDHVVRALSAQVTTFSDLVINPVTQQPEVSIAVPLHQEGRLFGVLNGELNLQAISSTLARPAADERFVTLLDRSYRVISRSDSAARYVGQSVGPERIALLQREPGGGSVSALNLDGEMYRVIWQRSSIGWTLVVGESVSVYNAPLRRSLLTLLAAGAVLLLLGALAGRIAARRLANQFENLKSDAQRLSEGLPLRPLPTRIAELHSLNETLQEAARHLEDTRASRERAMAALRQTDQRKDQFLAVLAHELRNPMAPLRNAVALLQGRVRDDPVSERMLTMADRQLRHLVRLVDDLLDVARITRGRLELKREPLTLQDLLREAIETTEPFLVARDQTLKADPPDDPVPLMADRVRLVQVFENLLSNASKYSDPGSVIEIEFEIDEASHRVHLRVRDHGVGLRSDELDQIFEVYRQIETSIHRSQGGLGIGLALVRRLVMLHGGTVTASSEGPGRGSCFEVILPLACSD